MKIGIYQIYYDKVQLEKLSPAFLPYDNTKNDNREWAEYHIFEKEFSKKTWKKFSYSGFISWKFLQKSQITGERFLEFMQRNPGADVYFINPFPMEEILFRNVWHQGEFYHKGILAFAQRLMTRLGHDADLSAWSQEPATFAFCNYWAGNPKFWKGYMEFTGSFARMLRTGLSEEDKAFLHSLASKTNNFSYIAFFMERLFSTYLWLAGKDIHWQRFEYTDSDLRRRFPGNKFRIMQFIRKKSRTPEVLKKLVKRLLLLLRRGREP